ncbi:hypothetical protein MalM25_13900 [Planctomycetes bacterium MalM25]|nr:hypothetical protein MalM25_13900 [Planctomycetes bacterium MalM25]
MISTAALSKLRFLAAIAILLSMTTAASAQFSASSAAEVSAGQESAGFVEVIDGDFSSTGAQVAFSGSQSFGDETETGVFEVSGSASASAVAGRLRANASATLIENSVFDFSTPYIPNGPGTSDNLDFGIPTTAGFSAFAEYTDRLQYGGTTTNYNSKYIFRVTGNITGSGGFAVVNIQHGGSGEQTIVFDQPGPYNEIMTSEAFVHGGAPQFFRLALQTTVDYLPEFDTGGSGSVQFGNTIELLGVELRDDDTGELLLSETITPDSGAGSFYQVRTAIPEPASAALLVLTLLAGAATRSRC